MQQSKDNPLGVKALKRSPAKSTQPRHIADKKKSSAWESLGSYWVWKVERQMMKNLELCLKGCKKKCYFFIKLKVSADPN